jgi:hypothetical protein
MSESAEAPDELDGLEETMRRTIVAILLLITAVCVVGQEARVIALKSEDAAHVRCTWERLQKAQKEWNEVLEQTQNDYILVPIKDKDASQSVLRMQDMNRTYRSGWENGFQFSSDFKYLVPKNVTTSGTISTYNQWPCWQWYTAPSIGTR